MIDRHTVRHVAALALLELTADEEDHLLSDLARIVEMVDALPPSSEAPSAAVPSAPAASQTAAPQTALPRAEPSPAGTPRVDGEAPPVGEPDGAGSRPACTVPLSDLFEGNAPVLEEGYLRLPPVRHEGPLIPPASDPDPKR